MNQRRLLGAVLMVGSVSACASLMGVDEPSLDLGATSNGDGGATANDGAVSPPNPNTDGCVGAGCTCASDPDCALSDPYVKCVAGKCAECTTDPTDSCASGYCLRMRGRTPSTRAHQAASQTASALSSAHSPRSAT